MSNIKVVVKDSGKKGKNILIMAGVHGDEVGGVNAFNQLIPKLKIVSGKVTFIYANLQAQKQNKRFVEHNLNRCFFDSIPKDVENTLEGKTSRELLPYLNEAEILLDLHSSNSADIGPFIICEKDCFEYVKVLSPKIVLYGIDQVQKGGAEGYMHNRGKIGVCVECGKHTDNSSVEVAKESIINFLTKAGALFGNPAEFVDKKFFVAQKMYKNKNGPFKLSKKYIDLQELFENELIGKDGGEEVFAKKDEFILFPNEPKETNKECFVIVKELK